MEQPSHVILKKCILFTYTWPVSLKMGLKNCLMHITMINVSSGLPSPPTNIRQTTTLGQQSYIVTVQWDPPLYDGGAPVDNYTVKTNSSEVVTSDLNYTFILTNNSVYVVSVSITAHNCAGDNDTVTLDVYGGIISVKLS